jgi:hypothetical protein
MFNKNNNLTLNNSQTIDLHIKKLCWNTLNQRQTLSNLLPNNLDFIQNNFIYNENT